MWTYPGAVGNELDGFGRFGLESRFQRAVAAERARLGDGPFLLITQVSVLDLDGLADHLRLEAGFAELPAARAESSRLFARLCEDAPAGPEWRPEAISHVPAPLANDVPEVRLIEQHGQRMKHTGGFHADTRIVQLLEIDSAPLVGEPLFRALRWSHDLVQYLLGLDAP